MQTRVFMTTVTHNLFKDKHEGRCRTSIKSAPRTFIQKYYDIFEYVNNKLLVRYTYFSNSRNLRFHKRKIKKNIQMLCVFSINRISVSITHAKHVFCKTHLYALMEFIFYETIKWKLTIKL